MVVIMVQLLTCAEIELDAHFCGWSGNVLSPV